MSITAIRGLALAVLSLAAVAAPARAALFNPETFTLDNGMQVVVVPNHRAPVVTHMVWYRVGSADEPKGKSGLAHLLEHLMFKGTEDKLEPGEFSRIVSRHGGQENAFTSYDYTGYFEKVAKDRLELMMELEADRMVNLVLTDEVVRPERDVVLEERLTRTENEPSALLREHVNAVQFLAYPYRVPVVGWKNDIHGLTTEDVIAFYRRHYAPNNAVLVVAGDITAAELRPLAEKHYGAIPRRDIGPRQRVEEPPQRAARRVVMRDAQVGQPEWYRSYLAPSYNVGATEHAEALQVLAEVLGAGTTSRLYRSLVVDQKVAASAAAMYHPTKLGPARFYISATPAPGVDVGDVEAAVDREVESLLSEGVTPDEVARVKERMIAETMYARDSLFAAARVFGAALTTGLSVEHVESWPQRIEAIDADDVEAAAQAVFRPERSVTGILLPDKTS